MKILFLINSLQVGGAERQLLVLAKYLSKSVEDVVILTFYSSYELLTACRLENIKLISLAKKGRWDFWKFIYTYPIIIKKEKPDIIYSFLPTPNLLSVCTKILSPKKIVIWRLAASDMNLDQYDWSANVVYKLQSLLSRIPDAIIANSYSGMKYAQEKGFKNNNFLVIHNGFDSSIFYPDKKKAKIIRKKWGVGINTFLVGLVARLDLVKDHYTFIKMAKKISDDIDDIVFVCIGSGDKLYQSKLVEKIKGYNLQDKFLWIDSCSEMNLAYNAMDCLCLSSKSEGLPNVIAEAMLVGVPVISTDVGDVKKLVNNYGIVVGKSDYYAMAEACKKIFNMQEKDCRLLSRASRKYIMDNFSVKNMLVKNVNLIKSLFIG